ncbi:cobalt/nickel transport system ATP-binding protein [Ancylobacter sp. 3268]|uniref:energy-coupling factor ABC transporter ATP-binding protein n=1 Tax=Ancylobacter sp. 3268 TaxID=2817752 RepID=UPI00285F33E7|nr:ABC transporter ATP-binding protein [Ancylobacter sp. 3268]MDR6955734.1 cobalt/nickel transport system ATP-binding protein [Ancylobacter sp. 3268]
MNTLIDLIDLTVTRAGKTVLTGVDLTLSHGERLALIGPNGAGKTTLLRSIIGLEPIGAGRIRLFGEACTTERDFRKIRPRIGFLFQDSDDQLFCPTVLEDVAFGPLNLGCSEEVARGQAMSALERLGIAPLAERINHRLSGGEKRLVCLAGLLAMKPDVLMLDEPTNGVDAENGQRLRQALHEYEGALLLVSHDDAFVAELATRAMLVRHGRLVAAEIHEHAHVHRHRHVHLGSE